MLILRGVGEPVDQQGERLALEVCVGVDCDDYRCRHRRQYGVEGLMLSRLGLKDAPVVKPEPLCGFFGQIGGSVA